MGTAPKRYSSIKLVTARGYIIEDSCKHDIMNEDEEIIVNLLRGPDDYACAIEV